MVFGELQTPPSSPSLTATAAATTTWLINRLRPRSGGHPDRDMSSPDDEVSVSGASFSSECGEQASGLEAGSTARQGSSPSPEPGAPGSGEGEGGNGFPDTEGFRSEREVLEAGGPWLRGGEGRPGSPALQLADKSVVAILQQLTDLNVLGTHTYLGA